MRFLTPYRIAAYVLVLFCIGHTAGGMLGQKSLGMASDAVFASMKAVTFDFNGSTCTWYGFWFGFGMTASIFLLLSALLAWQLDAATPQSWPVLAPVAWGLVVAQALNTVISWKYFFAGPGVFGILITALLAVGAWRKANP
jgi:hypothetical protein